MNVKKEDLKETLAEIGEDTSGSKEELKERLEDAKVMHHLEPNVYEGRKDALRENESWAKKLERDDEKSSRGSTPTVYEARKVK